MTSQNVNEIKEKYNEQIDLSENKLYQIGSVFFLNEGGYNISNILTDFTKISIKLVYEQQVLVEEQKKKLFQCKKLQKIDKNLMIDNKKQYFKYNKKYFNLKAKKKYFNLNVNKEKIFNKNVDKCNGLIKKIILLK